MDNKEFFNSIVDKIISNKHLIFNKKISLHEKIKDLLRCVIYKVLNYIFNVLKH